MNVDHRDANRRLLPVLPVARRCCSGYRVYWRQITRWVLYSATMTLPRARTSPALGRARPAVDVAPQPQSSASAGRPGGCVCPRSPGDAKAQRGAAGRWRARRRICLQLRHLRLTGFGWERSVMHRRGMRGAEVGVLWEVGSHVCSRRGCSGGCGGRLWGCRRGGPSAMTGTCVAETLSRRRGDGVACDHCFGSDSGTPYSDQSDRCNGRYTRGHCMLTIMRFGLMERLKALSMVAIITWTSREACGRISAALARHCGGAAPPDVTTDMLLAIIAMPDFVDGIDRAERDFTEVTCPRTHPDLALLLMWDRSCFLYWLRICIRAFWLSQV